MQKRIPAVLMRGGTSKALFFHDNHLPQDPAIRSRVVLAAFGGVRLTDKGPINWVYYTPERFERAVQEHKVVVMVFTAEWCLNCKALEESVLSDPQVVNLLSKDEVVPIKVDITGNNPQGKAKLQEVGSLTIPLLVVYSAGGKQVFKSDFYSVGQVKKAVEDALH